jgi:hypothetical protein
MLLSYRNWSRWMHRREWHIANDARMCLVNTMNCWTLHRIQMKHGFT